MSCSEDYLNKTICQKNSLSENCLIRSNLLQYRCLNKLSFQKNYNQEQSGANSRCFAVKNAAETSAGCFLAECNGSAIILMIENNVYQCTQKDQTFKVGEFEVVCPDVVDFCNKKKQQCFNDCNANGKCLNNFLCVCDKFFDGSYCNIQTQCQGEEVKICENLKKSFFNGEELKQCFFGLLFLLTNFF